MNCLIIGGTSGLGLSLAKKLSASYDVHITGRRDPSEESLVFHTLDLSSTTTSLATANDLLQELPRIDLLVYAAGFFQDGTVTDLTIDQIDTMLSVGLTNAIYLTRQLLEKQGELPEFIAITSTSQWTPRLNEPVYTAVKAGLGAYANSLSLDPRVKKTLVAGPAGMATNFWNDTDKKAHDVSQMLDPDWVADRIIELANDTYSYKFARILRGPARVEVQEVR
jgi:NAD(P)-dependent dehydrogenase (short-subunit alcohol dehydrogenase family)